MHNDVGTACLGVPWLGDGRGGAAVGTITQGSVHNDVGTDCPGLRKGGDGAAVGTITPWSVVSHVAANACVTVRSVTGLGGGWGRRGDHHIRECRRPRDPHWTGVGPPWDRAAVDGDGAAVGTINPSVQCSMLLWVAVGSSRAAHQGPTCACRRAGGMGPPWGP